MAEALAGNVAGMSSDERRVAENQLVDALALYRDIRLRDAGLNKLRQLERLGTVASAAGGDAATAREVAPLLATARREAELSDQLLDVVARYTAQKERRAALPSAADLRSRGLDANAARAVQSVEAAYARKQAQFVDDARSFAASRENPGGSRMMSASVDDVVANVRDLTRLNDLTEQAVAALPADVRQAEARLRVSPNGLKQAVTRSSRATRTSGSRPAASSPPPPKRFVRWQPTTISRQKPQNSRWPRSPTIRWLGRCRRGI